MDHAEISRALAHNGAWFVFLNVLAQQLGLPVPVLPTLILAGSLASGWPALAGLLAAAVLASVLADAIWFLAGRAFGYRVLRLLCRLSLNPASCVNKTETRFVRWGPWSLIVAKFIPGFSAVAPPVAGALRMSLRTFLFAAALGAALWAGLALVGGWVARAELEHALQFAMRHGLEAAAGIGSAIALWLGWKLWRRRRFAQEAAMLHIEMDALGAALDSDQAPLLLDLRGETLRRETGPISGARVAQYEALAEAVADWPKHALIVTLCACPEDAGAISAARQLMEMGYRQVRPLRGGFEAWQTYLDQAQTSSIPSK